MNIDKLDGKRILIIGAGLEGRATYEYLAKHVPTAKIAITDQHDGSGYLNNQNNFDIAIKSPGVPPHLVTIPYTTPTNLFFMNKGARPVIGVTGTKGKSTTASLIHHILSAAGLSSRLVGNIGIPAISVLSEAHSDDTWFVMELSSYQLADIHFAPHIAVAVSLFPEHMNYHGSIGAYYLAKSMITRYQRAGDYFIYNSTVPEFRQWVVNTLAAPVAFDRIQESYETQLIGSHNIQNIKAAVQTAQIVGIDEPTVRSAVHSFKPLRHRLQHLGVYQGISFYDDAISTTPESTIAALEAIPHVSTLFLGGQDRGYDFTLLAKKLAALNIAHLVLFPDSGRAIHQALRQFPTYRPTVLQTSSMREAVAYAFQVTAPGTVCLLSCASPSYSLWKSFEEKGDQFAYYISSYTHEKES